MSRFSPLLLIYFVISVLLKFYFLMVYKVKTSVQKKNVNPLWNDVLVLPVTDLTKPVKLVSLLFEFLPFVK